MDIYKDNSSPQPGSGVSFDSGYKSSGFGSKPASFTRRSKLIDWVIKFSGGLIKTDSQATVVLAVICIVVTLVCFGIMSKIASRGHVDITGMAPEIARPPEGTQ